MSAFAEKLQAVRQGVVYEYAIPESLRKGQDIPTKVGLQVLTADQELMASKSGRYDVMRTQYSAIKLSIVELDGKPVSYADGSVDKFWDNADPRIRSLLLQAYNKISSPTTEETDSFFGSEVVRV